MGQKDGKKWTAAADLQPTISKSDRLLALHPASARHKRDIGNFRIPYNRAASSSATGRVTSPSTVDTATLAVTSSCATS